MALWFAACCSAHSAEQIGAVHRLREEIRGARLDRVHAHRDVPFSSEKYNRQKKARARQAPLQFHAIEFRHRNIEDETRGLFRTIRSKKIACRAKRLQIESFRAQLSSERLAQVGYGASRPDTERLLMSVLLIVVSISFFLIADIDSPRGGFILVQPQNHAKAEVTSSLRVRKPARQC